MGSVKLTNWLFSENVIRMPFSFIPKDKHEDKYALAYFQQA